MFHPTLQRAKPTGARPLVLTFLVVAGAACPPAPLAGQTGPSLVALRQQALRCEADRDWPGACRLYDDLLRRDGNQPDVRDAYQRCLRKIVRKVED